MADLDVAEARVGEQLSGDRNDSAGLAGPRGAVGPGVGSPHLERCQNVAFTPNSDDVAANIRVRQVSCSYARDFIRDFDAAPAERYAGYRCTWRSVDPDDSLPYTRFRCSRGTQIMIWHRY